MSRRTRSVVVTAAVAAIVTAATSSEGAYFSQSWGWLALAFLMPTTVMLILGGAVAPTRLRAAFVLAIVAFAAWVALSSTWSLSSSGSWREVERMLVYVAIALAIALVLRRRDVPAVLAGVLTGITLVLTYALAARLLPDRVVVDVDRTLQNRLAQPLGFPNAVGVLAVMGVLLALGFIAQSKRPASAAAAGLAFPILTTALYFTFSRGAWAALILAFVIMVAADARRHILLASSFAVAVPAVACVLVASRQEGLTTSVIENATGSGGFAVVLAVGTVVSALTVYVVHGLLRRPVLSDRAVRDANRVLLAVVVLAFVVGIVAGASHLRGSFETQPAYSRNLDSRLFNVYGTGRGEIWTVAWHDFRRAPLVGEGAGAFEYSWYEHRESTRSVRDAHSLYLEVAAEMGVGALALLVFALLLPVVGAIRARRSRFVPCGLAAYVAWVVASGVDWHWEMVGLTTTALVVGGAGLLAADRRRARTFAGTPYALALAGAVLLSVAAVWSLVGNRALYSGQVAAARGEWSSAARDGRRAGRLLFWSPEPQLVLGDARAGLGDRQGALDAYRTAVDRDPRNWAAWLRLAQVADGAERTNAYARVRALNPLEKDLPGQKS